MFTWVPAWASDLFHWLQANCRGITFLNSTIIVQSWLGTEDKGGVLNVVFFEGCQKLASLEHLHKSSSFSVQKLSCENMGRFKIFT